MRTLFSAVGGSVAETADAAASTAGELSASGVALAAQAASAVPAVAASAAQLLGAVASNPLSASAVVDTVHSAPVEDPATSAPAANVAGSVVLRTTAESGVEVRDAAGGVLLSRMLLQGEAVGLDGALPMKLKIGNADGTQVSFRGQPVELQPYTRDNIARLELK
jgi:cytoskeleton protein RodZ